MTVAKMREEWEALHGADFEGLPREALVASIHDLAQHCLSLTTPSEPADPCRCDSSHPVTTWAVAIIHILDSDSMDNASALCASCLRYWLQAWLDEAEYTWEIRSVAKPVCTCGTGVPECPLHGFSGRLT